MHVEGRYFFFLLSSWNVMDGVRVGIWFDLFGVWVTTKDLYI
jgi:hypothetical protein